MLGQRTSHPYSTSYDTSRDEFDIPPAKRARRDDRDGARPIERLQPRTQRRDVIPDSDADSDTERLDVGTRERRTDLETTLPPIQTDREAIEAYEATRAADQTEYTEQGLEDRVHGRKWVRGRSSIYVDAFNLALDRVLEDEGHLFDEAEHAVFRFWRQLTYEAQYLYVRLFLRKTSTWHRINKLGYHSEIADLSAAIEQIQLERDLPVPSSQEAKHPGELNTPEVTALGSKFTFADRSEECIKDLEEASSLLLLDELKALAKEAKVQGRNKVELLRAFRQTSGKQTGLGFSNLNRSETEETLAINSTVQIQSENGESTHGRPENRDAHWIEKILSETGPCIRLSLPTLKLFERVHLVFYRSTEWTEKSLTTIILARISRWNFPEYIVSRSASMFVNRSLLLEFEAAVRTQFRVDSILEFNGTPTKESLQIILDVLEEVQPRWRSLLAEEQQKEDSIYSTGEGAYLRRLSPAWVYTRIVHKGAYVHGKFKNHKREYEVICELLAQRLFHTSRRGDWYQRKALLEEHYMHLHLPSPFECQDVESKKKHWKRIALRTCEEGLEDQLTHIVCHHNLQKRTVKLEKQLKIPKRQQHDFSHVSLAKPGERTFYGIRIERPPSSRNGSRRNSEQNSVASKSPSDNRGAKTIWLDPVRQKTVDVDTGEVREGLAECSVEEMCLSSYRNLGYKGYHSEGSILRTLFAYLFYDILFLYVPNVFQTEFQTCPLDLHTDAFYPSRMSEVHTRLNEISNGEAGRLIQEVWNAHFERKTCVVGLDWTYSLEDLREIADCFPPAALSTVMKVMAQEYGQRGGGVPDLFLWKYKEGREGIVDQQLRIGNLGGGECKGEVMFAEVKSENDRLSDKQRMWIDVLSGAGVKVELCHAVASEVKLLA